MPLDSLSPTTQTRFAAELQYRLASRLDRGPGGSENPSQHTISSKQCSQLSQALLGNATVVWTVSIRRKSQRGPQEGINPSLLSSKYSASHCHRVVRACLSCTGQCREFVPCCVRKAPPMDSCLTHHTRHASTAVRSVVCAKSATARCIAGITR